MCCFYYLTRQVDPAGAEKGPATLPIGYHFQASDRWR